MEQLPGKIESLEAEVESLQAQIVSPDFYSKGREEIDKVTARLTETEQLLSDSIERWMELEEEASS